MKKKLRIAQIAPLWTRIPPRKYGGIELIIKYLCDELTRRGHDVTLFASGDSQTKAKLKSITKKPLLDRGVAWTNLAFTYLNIAEAYEQQDKFDIIHAHNDIHELYFSYFAKTPTVHTMHNPLYSDKKINLRRDVLLHYKNANYVTISKSQLRLSDVKINSVKTVYNAIDTDKLKFNAKGADQFIWIARVDKYKGIENAIQASKQAGAKLKMAGRLDYTQREYFAKRIKKHIDGKRISFIGEIGAPQKQDFFGNAKALLYPIEWSEPFGLVMTEAMACGTPVIAFDQGSVREVVKNGVTGFIVKTIPEMVRAMKKIDTIDRAVCRAWVEKKFSIPVMVDGYEEVYEKVLRKTN